MSGEDMALMLDVGWPLQEIAMLADVPVEVVIAEICRRVREERQLEFHRLAKDEMR